jgi:hypothetical protein
LAQFQSGRDQNAVNLQAYLALEFEKHRDHAGIVSPAAQNPTITTEDCTS